MRSYKTSEAQQREARGRRLPQRFLASHAGGLGDTVYGVWDVARQAWHTPDKMTDDAAERLAADLNARHSRTGPRRDADWYHLDPPVPIDVKFLTWRPAELDYWVREPDGWYGHVLQPGSEPRWYPAELLRPRRTQDST
jgi:hypothetical protein